MSELFWDRQGQLIDLTQWASLHGDENYMTVGRDNVDGVEVSTVWLGLNHNFIPDKPPLLFETMCIGGAFDTEFQRYSTEEEAVAGHQRTVENLRQGKPPWQE